MVRGRTKPIEWPQLWYGPGGESAYFQERMYIPLHWTPYPQLKPEPIVRVQKIVPTKEELKALLLDKGVTIDPRWSIAKMEQLIKE